MEIHAIFFKSSAARPAARDRLLPQARQAAELRHELGRRHRPAIGRDLAIGITVIGRDGIPLALRQTLPFQPAGVLVEQHADQRHGHVGTALAAPLRLAHDLQQHGLGQAQLRGQLADGAFDQPAQVLGRVFGRVTDALASKDGTKGHQVIKFSPDGKVLMRIGKAGVAGTAPGELNMPNDVITNDKGEIFVADGHNGQNDNPPPDATGRIIKFAKDGTYIKE